MTVAQWIVLGAQIATLVILLFVLFLKSYLQEKGKNLATKEDIKDITNIVEEVKSQLNYSLQARLSLRAEEHNALVDYYTSYSTWLSYILNCDFVGFDNETPLNMAAIRSKLNSLYEIFLLSAGRVELFVEDPEIQRQHHVLLLATLKVSHHIQNATLAFQEKYMETCPLNQSAPDYLQQYRALSTVGLEAFREAKTQMAEMYTQVLPQLMIQRKNISTRLRVIAEAKNYVSRVA